MLRVIHLIDHNGLGGAQRLVAGIHRHYPSQQIIPLRMKMPSLFPYNIAQAQSFWQRTLISNLAVLWQVRSVLRQEKFDILHCHLQASWMAGLLLRRICTTKRVALVFHEHNPYASHSPIYRMLVRQAAQAGKIIAVSAHIRDQLIASGAAAQQIYLLPNFIDPQDLAESASGPAQRFVGSRENRILGFSGRLVRQKGWMYGLRVIEHFKSYPLELWIAGNGKEINKARNWVRKHGLTEQVRFWGFVKDMGNFYRALDILIHPALEEPFGLAPIEAQACGVAVVAFRFQGSAEVFGEDSAWLCPLGDINELINAVQRLLNDEDMRQDLIARGYVNALRFAPAPFFTKLERIYQDILG